MKKDELVSIKGSDIKALRQRAKELKLQIADLKMDLNTKQLKDLKSVSKVKKNLAVVLTVLRQKELIETLEKGAK